MRGTEKKSECGCKVSSSKTGVEPASCEPEQNKIKKKMKDRKYLSDSNFYNKTNKRCPNNVPQSPTPELMNLVHPGDPSFTGGSPGFLNPLVRMHAGSNTSLGPVRDLSSSQCRNRNRTRSSASSLQDVSSSIDAPANRSRARIVMKGDKVDKRGIEEVPFAGVHSLGADIVALIAEDASTDKKG